MNESPRWCIVLFHQPSAPYRCDHLQWVEATIFKPNNHSQNHVSFLNQIKTVLEIHWYIHLHVVNHWVSIHGEGKNVYNWLNYVYRPQGLQESHFYGLSLCFCCCALRVRASDLALLFDSSLERYPIPPLWIRVILGTSMRSPQDHSLDIVE